jgi:hypothetical protein
MNQKGVREMNEKEIQEIWDRLRNTKSLSNGIDQMLAIDMVQLLKENERFRDALREIDTHIRATPEPVSYIIETLKKTLPEYQE